MQQMKRRLVDCTGHHPNRFWRSSSRRLDEVRCADEFIAR
jgi:hypothetical protein